MREDAPRRISRPAKDRYRPPEYNYGSQKYSKNISEVMKKCFKLLSTLQKLEYGQPFLKPVDPVALNIPDYPLIVKEPMDLSKVDKRLRTGYYRHPLQFASDVRKIWSNAILYNPKSSPIYDMTFKMSEFFESKFKEIEENPFSDVMNEYIHSKVHKIEKKLNELKTSHRDMEKSLTIDDKKIMARMLESMTVEDTIEIFDILCDEGVCSRDSTSIDIDINSVGVRVQNKIYRHLKNRQHLLDKYNNISKTHMGMSNSKRKNTEDEEEITDEVHDRMSQSSYFTNLNDDDNNLEMA